MKSLRNKIIFLLHKYTCCPIYECEEAFEKAIDYLRSLRKVSG